MSEKILIVEDDIDFANLVSELLTRAGYTTTMAKDGKEAHDKIDIEKPDLILLDIIMPKIDGYNFLRALKLDKDTKDILVIILTAKTKMKELFSPEGVVDYITKPFDQKELLENIEKALSR